MSSDTASPPATAAAPPPPRLLLGVTLALLGAALFATKGIVVKLAIAEGVDPLTTLTWRMLVAVPIFLSVGLFYYRRRRAAQRPGDPAPLDRTTLLQTLGVGVLGYYVASYLDFQALEYISAQLDRLILLTYPFFVVLFGAIFFRRRVTPLMMVALVVSWVGIALIFAHDLQFEGKDVVLGSTLVLISAIAYAAYQIIAKPLIDRMGPELFTSIAMSGAGPAVIVHFLLTHPLDDLAVSAGAIPLMLAIGTVSTVLPAYCTSGGIGLLGSERTAMIGNISPVVTVALAIGVLGEVFTVWHAIGTIMVLAGVWLFGRGSRRG